MLGRIKGVFLKEQGLPKIQRQALERLPPGERLAALAVTLHELSVDAARRFVEEEHRRADSPFRDIAKADLFHELLVLNFWIFETLFRGRQAELMDAVYRHYSTFFVWGWGSGQKELLDSMQGKFRIYEKAWDDYTGHQDVFARRAIGIIFGDRRVADAPQAAFWLITHADRTRKAFGAVKKWVDRLLPEPAGRS